LEEYGMMINADSVTRTVYYKYFHPKEVLVSTGVINREINKLAGKSINDMSNQGKSVLSQMSSGVRTGIMEKSNYSPNMLSFVYSYGATLNVDPPAIPILSSGPVSYPLNRPVAAVYVHPASKGKILVLGSSHMFSDSYLDKEENARLVDAIFMYLTNSKSAKCNLI
jgi:intraflagellar transport protein 52